MNLVFNELSIHGQFYDIIAFRDAIRHVMTIRKVARQFGSDVQCNRNVVNAQVTRDLTMLGAVQALNINDRRALMQWLTRHGPFWEDFRQHSQDDWLECDGEIVTDTAVGEVAYCLFYGISRGLVSVKPSSWLTSPLSVDWCKDEHVRSVDILNYWDVDELRTSLAAAPASLQSWDDLATMAHSRYPDLTFSSNSFEPLHGHPFGKGAAERLLLLLSVLHDLKNCFDERGNRSPEGHALYQNHFVGDKAWFSDSSDREKNKFEKELLFPNPANPEEFLFCTWHGKVKTPQLRIHFSWPIKAEESLYVVYVGPKITKQ